MASNPILNVSGETKDRLNKVLELSESNTAVGFVAEEAKIVFFRFRSDDMTHFPCPLDMKSCADLAFNWLQSTAKYPREPDIDGSVEKGWRCYTEAWGHIQPYGFCAFVAVEPYWMEFGK